MRKKSTSRVFAIIIGLALIFGAFANPFLELGSQTVYAAVDTTNITSWSDLNTAINVDGATGDLIIAADLYADSTIPIPSNVTIKGKDDKTYYIYQAKRDKYDTMFKVTSGGNLTLGTNLTLSGKVVSCGPGTAQAEEKTEDNTHTLSEYAVTETAGNAKAKFLTGEGYKLSNTSGNEINLETRTTGGYDATEFEIVDSMLKLNGQYVYSYGSGRYQLNMNTDRALKLCHATTGNFVQSSELNTTDEYILYDPYVSKFISWNGNQLVSDANNADALKFKATDLTAASEGGSFWDIPTDTPITDSNNITRFKNPDQQTEAEAALENLNKNLDPKRYKHVPGADLTVITNKYYYYPAEDKWVNSSGKNIDDAMEAYNAAHQSCDGGNCPEPANNPTYTSTTFDSGIVDANGTKPHGFFVQVEGGTATLAGATLENFITSRNKDNTPKHVAPVAVYGTSSTFNVESGTIKNNIVGYVVNDNKANENANAIKMYVKGGAPNAPRAGDLANKTYRRNRGAGIDGNAPGSGITGTAGAILYADGAQGEITGGNISMNRGDTGGVMATGSGTVVQLLDNTDINQNVGVQFGGGVTTENGAKVKQNGGTIRENVAWFGGGGVYATENGVAWLLGYQKTLDARKDGIFEMYKGSVDGNTAFTRGGGFLVDSDGVALLKGTIKNNMSRMLGGGMYVMGDDPRFTYTVYINKGYVHENRAVSAGPVNEPYRDTYNDKLSQKLQAPNGCNGVSKLFDGIMSANSDDTVDGYPGVFSAASDGTGGGVWLCAYGNTVLNVEGDAFVIDKNYASGSFRHGKSKEETKVPESTSSDKAGGNDIHKETKGSGNIVIFGIRDDSIKWYDENTGEHYTSLANSSGGAVTDFSLKNLTNKGSFEPKGGYSASTYDGVDVFGNLSRRGGGLAADGSFMFGEATAIGEAYSELAVTKTWMGGTQPKDVTIRISLEYKDGADTKTIQVIELPLSETAKDSSELDTVFTDGSKDVDGNKVFMGHIVLPITVEDENGNKIQIFDLVSDSTGKIFELNTAAGLLALAEHLDGGGTVSLSTKDRRLIYEELVDDGTGKLVKAADFEITPSAMRLSTNPGPKISKKDIIKQLQTDGTYKEVGSTITSDIRFEADLYNDKPSEIDKYVNKAVHKDIDLSEEFEYDIIAYVKHGTDKIIIEDQLADDLEFVSKAGEVQVVSLDKNNHEPKNNIYGELVNSDASVAQAGSSIDKKTVDISKDNKLTVTIENKLDAIKDAKGDVIGYKNAPADQDLTALWGKWVKVTYKARIKKDLQEKIKAGKMKVSDLKSVTIKDSEKYKAVPSIFDKDDRPTPNVGNDPVKSDEDHKGIPNTASYSLEVKNEPAFRDESNTVTVKPEEPELEKYVNQAVHKDIVYDEVFTYDIIGYITKDADKVIFEDQLVDDLEFAEDPEVKVVYLDKNNHKPKNDINGEEVNGDASVAEAGTPVPEDGLTIETSKDGKLTVTIDDGVKVNESTGAIERNRSTVKDLRGKYVKVTFKAQIKKSIQEEIKNKTKSIADLSSVTVKETENDPVLSDEAHKGIVNEASMKIEVGNKGKYDVKSNKVTVKPEEPEIEKYINEAVHKDVTLDEVFTYDIVAYITKDAEEVVITDELNDYLAFVSEPADVQIHDLGTANNHKVTNNIKAQQVNQKATVAEEGKAFTEGAGVDIDGQLLTVEIPDASSLRGHWLRVRFQCKIKEGVDVEDLKYTTVEQGVVYSDDTVDGKRTVPNLGNEPVDCDEDHTGVPNTASYVIKVDNEAKYDDTSNTVTVKPDVEFIDLDVTKVWDEFDNDSSRRPTSITISLLKNGEDTGKSLTLTEDDDWKGMFGDLPKYDGYGNEISYTVVEDIVDYYYYDVEWLDEGYIVQNHSRPWIPRIPGTPGNVGAVKVTKTVSGGAEANKDYKFAVKFTYKDGETYTHEFTLNPKTNKEFLFDYIPVGTKVEIKEKTTGYKTTYTMDGKAVSEFEVEIGKTHNVVVDNHKSVPNSGDETNIALWVALVGIGALGLLVLLVAKNRKAK